MTTRKLILIVGKNSCNCSLLAACLEKEGYETRIAGSLVEADAMISYHSFALAFVDAAGLMDEGPCILEVLNAHSVRVVLLVQERKKIPHEFLKTALLIEKPLSLFQLRGLLKAITPEE